jgi:hypothetical protein
MSATETLGIGDDVYVRNPQRLEPGCASITGPIVSIQDQDCVIDAYVARVGGGKRKSVTVALADVGRRVGTPISALSGRPGSAGFAEFSRIASSWGYE